jgi:hypothetical protein
MPIAMMTSFLSDPVATCRDMGVMVEVAAVLAVGWFVVFHPLMIVGIQFVKTRPWWERAQGYQRSLMINFGVSWNLLARVHFCSPPFGVVVATRCQLQPGGQLREEDVEKTIEGGSPPWWVVSVCS